MKLYRCEVTFTYYCLAENRTEAGKLCRDAASDIWLPDYVDAEDVQNGETITSGWTSDSLVYGAPEGITLAEAFLKYTP